MPAADAGGVATLARPEPPAPPAGEFTMVDAGPAASVDEPSKGSRRWLIALVAIAAILGLGFVAGNLLDQGSTAQVESTAPVVDPVDESADSSTQVAPSADAQADDTDEVVVEEPDAAPASPSVPMPVPETSPLETDEFEPVVEVAKAVGPAVVLITVPNFGQGSGIIYDESGLLVTNAHVVGNATQVNVQLANGYKVVGEVLGRDPDRDIAVVQINTDADFGVAVLAPQSTVEVGQLAVAIGSPFGLDQTVTAGIVSAIGRSQPGLGERSVEMVQTDAPINPGNSGGALADRQGRVIGMNTAIRTDGVSSSNAGVGFAIPADTFKLIADRLIAGESLESGYLGVNIADPLEGEPGALVDTVQPGTAADSAGLQALDLIVGFNGVEVLNSGDLVAGVQLARPGASVTITWVRDGQTFEAEVVLGTR